MTRSKNIVTITLKLACAIALVAISYPASVTAKDSAHKKDTTLTVRKAGGDSPPEYRKKSTGKASISEMNTTKYNDSSSTNLFRGTGSSWGQKTKGGYSLKANQKL